MATLADNRAMTTIVAMPASAVTVTATYHTAPTGTVQKWNRLEASMDVLAAFGLGIHFMFYSDDAQRPPW